MGFLRMNLVSFLDARLNSVVYMYGIIYLPGSRTRLSWGLWGLR